MNYREQAELLHMAASLIEIGGQFAMTKEDLIRPDAGKRIVERIHNIQTAYNIRQGLHDKISLSELVKPLEE